MVVKPFEQVVAKYGPMVLRVCRAVLGPVDAEDAWSETFLGAMKAYPELDEDANIEAWLVTIAHRRAIDVRRAQARRPVAMEQVPERPIDPVEPSAWDDLWEALRELPRQQRVAVSYHYVAGLPYKEVAAITGVSTVAARKAASDGIRRLRATYAGAVAE